MLMIVNLLYFPVGKGWANKMCRFIKIHYLGMINPTPLPSQDVHASKSLCLRVEGLVSQYYDKTDKIDKQNKQTGSLG